MHHAGSTKIAELAPGGDVEGVFACTGKERLTGRGGVPYLRVELRDASGKIGGRVFRDAAYLDARFDRGDVVRVAGRVESFRGERQFNIRSIERAEGGAVADPRAFLPTAYRDLDELDGFLEHLAREVHDPGLSRLLDVALGDDALRERFRTAPCTIGGHHAYLGGLLEHTVAVTMLAQSVCDLHRRLDSDLLLTAALLHDVGKVDEFEYGAEITVSQAGRLLGHVTLGMRTIGALAARAGDLDDARELALMNCVLSHHGPRDGGKRFASAEALALFQVNAVDAQVKGALEHGVHAGGRAADQSAAPAGTG